MKQETIIAICMIMGFILCFVAGLGLGTYYGAGYVAETWFEILDHIQIKEVNFDINETELMNTMFDRFQEDYDLNLSLRGLNESTNQ